MDPFYLYMNKACDAAERVARERGFDEARTQALVDVAYVAYVRRVQGGSWGDNANTDFRIECIAAIDDSDAYSAILAAAEGAAADYEES